MTVELQVPGGLEGIAVKHSVGGEDALDVLGLPEGQHAGLLVANHLTALEPCQQFLLELHSF